MGSLPFYRKKIDVIDKKIVKLLLSRFKFSKQIASYKKRNKMGITDKKRERGIISNIGKHSNKNHQKFFKKFFSEIIKYSKKIQRQNGKQGTFI